MLSKPVDLSVLLSQIAALLNLEWSDDTPPEAREPAIRIAGSSTDNFIVPPHEEMEALHYLARLGDMRAIVQHTEHLTELDERYRPFADHLCQLAKRYRSQAIVSFVEQYRGARGAD